MDDSRPVPEMEALLEHAVFIRRVALSVLGDEAAAEDVVQATMMAALERPPRKNLRAWLATVARNLALSTWRSERSRGRREQAAARRERLPSAGDVVARLENQRRVVDAVMRLDEPYRSAIVHRYFFELGTAEVAGRLGVPVQTVRTRLKRAIGKLRTRLRDEHGGERAMVVALAPLAGRDPFAVPAAVATIGGGILMKLKVAVAAVLMVGAALLFWNAVRGDPDRTPRRESSAALAPAVVAKTTEQLAPAPVVDGVACAGTVVGPMGRATAGADVVALPWVAAPRDASSFWRDVGARPAARPLAIAKCDARGAFRMELPRGEPAFLRATAKGLVSLASIRIDGPVEGIVLRLFPAGAVRGIVVDAADRPVKGARVRMLDLIVPSPPLDATTTTGAAGAFSLNGLPCGILALLVDHPAYAGVVRTRVAVPARDLRIRLRPGRRVEGIVRTAAGEPAADAEVVLVPVESTAPSVTTQTDARGRFAVERVARYPLHLFASAGARGSAHLKPEETGTADRFEVTLDPVRTIRGRVFTSGPGGRVGVAGVLLRIHEMGLFFDALVPVRRYYQGKQEVVSGDDGYFTVEGISPAAATILVDDSHPRYGTRSQGIILAADREGADQPVDVMVFEKHVVAGVVRAPDGTPVAGARVDVVWSQTPPQLSDTDGRFSFAGVVWFGQPLSVRAKKFGYADGESLRVQPKDATDVAVSLHPATELGGLVVDTAGAPIPGARVAVRPAEEIVTFTDADGSFRLDVPEGQNPELMATHSGHKGRVDPLDPETRTLVLRPLDPRAALSGRVLDRQGAPIAGAWVHISPVERVYSSTARTDLDGRYEYLDLRARHYHLTVRADGFRTTVVNAIRPPAEKDFVLQPGLTIKGRILDDRGAPMQQGMVVATLATDGNVSEAAFSDHEGRFELKNLAPGSYNLRVTFQYGRWRPVIDRPGVEAGTTGVELRLAPAGEISGRVVTAAGEPIGFVEVFARRDDGEAPQGGSSAWTDAKGRFRIQGLHGRTFRVSVGHNRRVEFPTRKRSEMKQLSAGYASRPVQGVPVGKKDLKLRRAEGLEISGTVVGIDGLPKESAGVAITSHEKWGSSGRVATDAHGNFSMKGLEPGTHRIEAWAPDGTRAKVESVESGTAALRIELTQVR